jgi:uncharacterized protein (TIGR03083 family)
VTAYDPESGILPAGLRERVLTASRRARAIGRSVPEVPEITPTEAFRRAADAFYTMLCGLTDDDWPTPVLRDLDVQCLVGHLIGVEADVCRGLSGDPTVAEVDHVDSTQPAAIRQGGRTPEQTRLDWRTAADRTLRMVDEVDDLDVEVAVHGMQLSLGALLVVRAFELWIHDNDIRRATRLPPSVPDASTLGRMTGLAAELLPHSAARLGQPDSVAVRLVLTGPGGGTWDIAMGEGAPRPPALRLVTDAVGFCQLAANRITATQLHPHITGDPVMAAEVMTAVAALALD